MSEKALTWIKAAGVRAIKTGAQVFSGFLIAGAAFSEINWVYAASVTGVAMISSLVTSAAGLPELKE